MDSKQSDISRKSYICYMLNKFYFLQKMAVAVIWRQLVMLLLVLWPRNDLTEASVCKLKKDKIVKNLSTKTPYAYMLDQITPNEDLNVSMQFFTKT